MFSARFFIRPGRRTVFLRAHSTASSSRPPTRSIGLGSAAVTAGAIVAGWYGRDLYFAEGPKAGHGKNAALPNLEPEHNYPFQFLKPPTPAEVTEILTQKTWSFNPVNVPGVSRCDGAQLPSNSPIEDRFLYGKFPSPFQQEGRPLEQDWLALGVFDGHCGSATSEAVSKAILPYVYNSLRKLTQPTDEAAVDQAIKDGFTALDDVFMQGARKTMDSEASFGEKVLRLMPGANGSCALLALFDPSTRTLRVACTGDSRAVLGYQNADGGWETVPLSVDQNVKNAAEMERVQREHPGEDGLVNGSYYMGLQPMRVFGDGRNKWPLELYNEAGNRFNINYYGRKRPQTPKKYKTPPYHTARPEVVTIKLEKGRPAFLILGTDGLWDTMSSEQGVGLVGRWVDWVKAGRPPRTKEVVDFGKYDLGDVEDVLFEEKKATVQDDNVAVHLMRNALGGVHHELISGLLAFKPTLARKVRDDMTVQTVFFEG
ncbi:protein serine/threonine phosphatase 2C [Stipitochalara longipes BDJ]|nr:protein serine/threonine phosphatase 2C [Stipitochalara longipes BDJ]